MRALLLFPIVLGVAGGDDFWGELLCLGSDLALAGSAASGLVGEGFCLRFCSLGVVVASFNVDEGFGCCGWGSWGDCCT